MLPNTYSHLNKIQIGSFGEAYVKMAFTLIGYEVYTPEYDDRGIDFVTRNGSDFFLVQVKTVGPTANPFIYESKFPLTNNFLFAAVQLIDGHIPSIYLTRRIDWDGSAGCLNHNIGGGTSGPYFEIRFSNVYTEELKEFEFATYVQKLSPIQPSP